MDHGMTGIVLAGGKASRMGDSCDKAFLKIGNETIMERQLKVLRNFFKEIIIVTNSSDRYEYFKDVKIISDLIREKGPIGGIYSGLIASDTFYNLVVACDMPFLNEPLIRHMIENKDGYDVVVPEIDGKYHPLFGIYSKNCIPAIAELIKGADLHVMSIFSKVRSRFLVRREIERFDSHLASFANINTKEDYKACLAER